MNAERGTAKHREAERERWRANTGKEIISSEVKVSVGNVTEKRAL